MSTFQFHPDNTIPHGDWIWVFGSNTKGIHGKGAAKVAKVNFGAAYGVGRGRTGNAYAIATKDARLATLPLDSIQESVANFLEYAEDNPKLNFFVTRIGCVLAGYSDAQIAPMFAGAPGNCSLPDVWREYCVNVSKPQPVHTDASTTEGPKHG